MALILSRSGDHPPNDSFDRWAAVDGGNPTALDESRRVSRLAQKLEDAFLACREQWWRMGRDLAREPSAELAHAPSCAGNVSDLGTMLAWSRLAQEWASGSDRVLLFCDDPWLFRHLAGFEGVECRRAPALWTASMMLAARGMLARTKVAVSMAWASLTLRQQRRWVAGGHPAVVSYGHPRSTMDGVDGYFGALLTTFPTICRLLHVDCLPRRARELAAQGRTATLSAFGQPHFAFGLIFAKWRPTRDQKSNWLVRRAAAKEGGHGQSAMIAWQRHCQRRWLQKARPSVIAWPWENHGWERALVRDAERLGISTLGYQHSVVGGLMANYSVRSNRDGLQSIPNRILCTGLVWLEQLNEWGLPLDRLTVGGAWRFPATAAPRHDPSAPIFVALPFNQRIAKELLTAVFEAAAATPKLQFLVKEHPMMHCPFTPNGQVAPTTSALLDQDALSAVIYAASTVGLESLLAGLPTIRFQSLAVMSPDLNEAMRTATADSTSLQQALDELEPPNTPARDRIFAEVDPAVWQRELIGA